ncbi:hypothetical protein ACHAP4_010892 [Fusarium culmorum]
MSEIYYPDPQVLSEMEQHQVFRGFKASSDVQKYVLPERVLRLLGKDFQLDELNVSEDNCTSPSKAMSLFDEESLSEEESKSEKEALSEIWRFCKYCHAGDGISDSYDSSDSDGSVQDTI